jgi:hypothetical protein
MDLAPVAAVLPLRLRMVHSQGVLADVVVPLDAGRALALTGVLAASPVAIPSDQQAAAAHCRIVDEGRLPDGHAIWWLINQSAELRCGINGQPIAQGERARLNEGNVLDIGMTRCVVETTEPALRPTDGVLDDMPAPGQADPAPGFQLADLLTEHADAVQYPASAVSDASPHDIADAGQETAPSSETTTQAPESDEARQLIGALHAEYLRLLRDPRGFAPTQEWSPHRGSPEHGNAVGELQGDEGRRDGLYDLLGADDAMASVLAGLDSLGEHDLLEPEAHVDVLRLFAPHDLREERHPVPELTRREHHVLTADSAAPTDRPTGALAGQRRSMHIQTPDAPPPTA